MDISHFFHLSLGKMLSSRTEIRWSFLKTSGGGSKKKDLIAINLGAANEKVGRFRKNVGVFPNYLGRFSQNFRGKMPKQRSFSR